MYNFTNQQGIYYGTKYDLEYIIFLVVNTPIFEYILKLNYHQDKLLVSQYKNKRKTQALFKDAILL